MREDLKADNFLVGFEDSSVLDEYVKAQKQTPNPYKEGTEQRVYQSQPDFGRFRKGTGVLKMSYFGAAVFDDATKLHYHDIQPEQFAAPEVLLGAGWTYGADVWNLGMMVSTDAGCRYDNWVLGYNELTSYQLWELLKDISLLDGTGPENQYSRPAHFAQMIRLLGPPPAELLQRANKEVYGDLYFEQGTCGSYPLA